MILPAPQHPLTERSRNLVRFCRHLPEETMAASFAADYGFRDAGSRFALLKSVKTAPGPDECFGLWARDDRTVFRKLLGMTVAYDGLDPQRQANMTPYGTMNYYRSHVVEHFCHNGIVPLPPTEGECTFWFAAADVLCIRYRLVNKSAVDVPVRLGWFAEGEPGETFSATPAEHGFRFENHQTVIRYPYTSHAELWAEDDDVVFAAEGATLHAPPVARTIPACGCLDCRFAVRFWFNDEPPSAWPAGLWSDATLEQAVADAESAYARLPELPTAFARHLDLTLKAAGTLRSLRYRDYDRDRRQRLTIHVGKSGTAATWFWDTGASLPGLALAGEREAAAGAIRLLLDGIQDDGTPPMTYERQGYIYGYQIPLVTWGVGHYLAYCPDDELLSYAYPRLARYVQHWLDHSIREEKGLAVYPPGGTALDDALRWHSGSPLAPRPGQPWYEQEWGHSRPDLFFSPDINAFLYLELQTLTAMAAALGHDGEADAWRTRAEALAAAINAWLIEPETRTYQDRHCETGVFTGLVNLASFIPIYAGIAPPEIAETGCRDYLLSPAHFLTALPFPVIDRAHPTFRAGGWLHSPPAYPGALVQQAYWMGRTWLHGDCWLLGALRQGGFEAEADAVADRILEAVGKNEGIHECYDSLTGYGNGHPEFLWSSAAVLALAHRFYARPPVATLAPGLVPAAAPGPVPAAAPAAGSSSSTPRKQGART
jgi:hypothetical protein